ncbi:hypothetical protein IJD44_01805 [bacterium]|nr:hypothetical protein [bacterium]
MFKKIRNLSSFKRGQTLSEMLITQVIIGVVFTISMGTLVADHHKDQTVVRLKKAYSTFANALNSSRSMNGSPETWDVDGGLSDATSYSVFAQYLKPYIILSKDCETSTEGQCDYDFKELNGTVKSLPSTWARFFLNDGTFVAMQSQNNENFKVLYFYIDTNGKKRLNVVARDIFMFEYWIQNDTHPEYVGQFLPYGHEYMKSELMSSSNPNNCSVGQNGNYCGALIMKDGWKIIKGYPWAQARYVIQ